MAPRTATHARRHELATRLIGLAEEQITGTGLAELRARSLAAAAGCSVGTIYSAFPDLDEVILRVNARTLDAIDAVLDAVALVEVPAPDLVRLAEAYLDYASVHRRRWAALFQHRMAGDRPVPDWYVARQRAAFTRIEVPLARLRPDLPVAECRRLARSLFGAVHGMMVLGLDSLLEPTTAAELREQVGVMVRAIAKGLGPDLMTPPASPR